MVTMREIDEERGRVHEALETYRAARNRVELAEPYGEGYLHYRAVNEARAVLAARRAVVESFLGEWLAQGCSEAAP